MNLSESADILPGVSGSRQRIRPAADRLPDTGNGRPGKTRRQNAGGSEQDIRAPQ